jgi:hypothetical protein
MVARIPHGVETTEMIVPPDGTSSRSLGSGRVEIRNRTPLTYEMMIETPARGGGADPDDGSVAVFVRPGRRVRASPARLEVRNLTDSTIAVLARPLVPTQRVSRAVDAAAKANSELGRLSLSATEAIASVISDELAKPGVTEDDALSNAAARLSELALFTENAMQDLRLELILQKPAEERDTWAAALTWQSAEKVGLGLTRATWGLVAATVGLVAATIVLIFVTASDKTEASTPPKSTTTYKVSEVDGTTTACGSLDLTLPVGASTLADTRLTVPAKDKHSGPTTVIIPFTSIKSITPC